MDRVLEQIVQVKVHKARADARAQYPAGDGAEEEFEEELQEAYAEIERKWGPQAQLCDAFIHATMSVHSPF